MFFVLEKFIHWRHCHIPTSKSHPHPLAFMNLVGDGLHNLIDGMIIGGAYLASTALGVTTTIAVILHEIPQEIGDFGVLLHAGLKKTKALFYNFLSALTAVIGVIISITIGTMLENYLLFLLPLTAGGFIYIAGSDLIPELHKECEVSKSFIQFIWLILGIGVMLLLRFFHLH
jgi:zinc and cadmium transporter